MKPTLLLYIIGPVILAIILFGARRLFNPTHTHTRTIIEDVVQGFFAGAAVSIIVVLLVLPNFYITQINGWTTMLGCGELGSNIFLRAACSVTFAGPINVSAEAVYWTTSKDGAGNTLSGAHDYMLHFPVGDLPPNNAFWSLTMADAKNHFVANSLNRYSVSDRSGLVQNADGSTDIYIQNTDPAGHEANWLPAPTGNFILWLRDYLPGQTVLDGRYMAPPVVETP